jgi:hypothetical protein
MNNPNPIGSCASKQRHVSEAAAHAAIKVFGTGMFDSVYPCTECNGYHIATNEGAMKIKARRGLEKTAPKKTVSKFKNKRSR